MTITGGANSQILTSKTFLPLPLFDIDFELKAKCFNQEGNLKLEYNPLRNLRLPDGQLTDFRTKKLNLSLNSPVDITVQPSYDGTVNLILNDDRNTPKLINSRFTPIEDDRYKIIDRKGNNDTNLYDTDNVEQTTRLFKTTEKIPLVKFTGLYEGGQMKCGNYVFYFKYSDADGNESDIITESSIISCYVGKINDPFSTRGGLGDELTNKIIKFDLLNLDTTYDYLNIYYTRSTGTYTETEITEAYKVSKHKTVSGNTLSIALTGLEEVQRIPVEDLNIQYNIVDKVKSQAQVQNMLFFGNVDKPTIPYKELEDLALRIYPTVSNDENIGFLDHNYNKLELKDSLRKAEYNDAYNVYKFTGYWNKEMYRLGVVYVLKDDSLSPVFPVRGKNVIGDFARLGEFNNDIQNIYTYFPLYNVEGKRQYVEYDDDGFIPQSQHDLENSKGVVRISYDKQMLNKNAETGVYPLSIDFNIGDDTLEEIKKHAKGFFFVRQKRIPTILAQGITIGVDDISFTPMLKASVLTGGQKVDKFISESFMDKSNQLVNDFQSRLLTIDNATAGGLICPEAQLRSEYFNDVFAGTLFNISKAPFSPVSDSFDQSNENNRHFFIKDYKNQGASDYLYTDIKLTNIGDDIPWKYNGTKTFSTRAGIPNEAWKYSWFGNEDRNRYATNLIRGSWSGFTGMEGFSDTTEIVDIHIPGFSLANLRDYFLLRADSNHPFFAMSDRYDLTIIKDKLAPYDNTKLENKNIKFKEYRGDCFIGNHTVRMMRNFQEPDVPTNDIILDTLTWKNNYTGFTASGTLNKDDIAKINRADVNAVRIGHWATFKLCSNINLAYRAIDESHSSETALAGKYRSFFPLAAMSVRAESKIPDSDVVNVGYNSTTSDRIYFTVPDVPYLKAEFDNRIMFSDIHITDAFKNNYRVFQGLSYKDLTKQYGAIVKLFEWKGNLIIVFENGVGLMPINERAIGGAGIGGDIFIKGAGVLSEIIVPLSTNYGSRWKESVIETPNFIYGIDTIGKKIWRTNGETFELISDFKVQKFLNDNITLGETEKTPMIALRNVKTHYNAFKQDVMFTFYDAKKDGEEIEWNLCFNEQLNKFITRYSWIPVGSENINNIFFSFDKDSAKHMARIGYTLTDSDTAEGLTLSDVNIKNRLANSVIGTLSLKGKNYYTKHDKIYTLLPGVLDNDQFIITGDQLKTKNANTTFSKYSFTLKIKIELTIPNTSQVIQTFYDTIGIKVERSILTIPEKAAYDIEFSTWFWKHGQAGIFDITTPILPTMFYDKQRVFEFEFVATDNPSLHKIFNNLFIISNNAEPDSFEFEVVGDSYSIDNITQPLTVNTAGTQSTLVTNGKVFTYQKGLDLKTVGRLKGNMHYKEDHWNVEIKPQRFTQGIKIKEARIRDKYCIIRVRYSGTKLTLITALQTLFTQSYA